MKDTHSEQIEIVYYCNNDNRKEIGIAITIIAINVIMSIVLILVMK